MKTIEEIEKEYEQFTPKNSVVKDVESFLIYLDVEKDTIDEDISNYKKEYRENRIIQISAKIRNLFFLFFQQQETDFYDEDNDLICRILVLMFTYKIYIEKIDLVATSDNYKELLKLYEFIIQYYDSNYEYLELLRRQLESRMEGHTFVDYSKEDNIEVIDEFFHKKISCITNKEIVVKKKKMC